MTAAEAVALVHPRDTLAVPLGPGIPGDFLHALGERDEWDDLQVFGALLLDLYAVFTKPGVHYRSGFFGPAERLLRDSGADIQFIPADFRRFEPLAERLAPRIMATLATPPDADGNMSLSLHAGATVTELHRAAADPDRLCVVETSGALPRTIGIPPQYPHTLHIDEVDVVIPSERPAFTLEEPPPTDVDIADRDHARKYIADGCTLQSGIGGVPSTMMSLLANEAGGDYGVHSEMFTTGLMHLQRGGQGLEPAQGNLRRILGHDLRARDA